MANADATTPFAEKASVLAQKSAVSSTTVLAGALVGAAVGAALAYTLAKKQRTVRLRLSAGQAVKMGMVLLGAARQLAALLEEE